MPDKKKVLKKVREGTKNVRAPLLRRLMALWGFELQETKKHGVKYLHSRLPDMLIYVTEHKEKGQENKIFEPYVKTCIKAIDKLRVLDGEDDEG